jgi:hypothetical protein
VLRSILWAVFALWSSSVSAQSVEILEPPPPVAPEVFARDERGRVTLRATRLTSPLSLDGSLDEAIYKEVQAIDHFVQQEPDEGASATEKTLVWLFFDDDNFYVSVRSFDTQPDRLVANELRRDNFNIYNNDNITISIDPLYTRRSGVFFQTNALSAQRDQEVQDERSNNNDWNTIWRTRSRILADGWSMEFAIPYSSLRFRQAGPQVWGFNMRRVVRWKNEHVSIAPIPASAGTRAMYKFDIMATVVGIETPSVRKPIDFKPYAIASSTTNLAAATPFRNDPDADAGFDVKYSLTNSLVADVTVRTDFAQVEEDQQQINLTRFSLFFPEKRDFFLEGQGLFSFAGSQVGNSGGGLTPVVFYTRRIGLGPRGEIPIVAGGRVAGRAGKYQVGLLNIQTEEEDISNTPSTNFSVVRVRRDFLRRSNIGGVFTRRTPIGGNANTVVGGDANLFFFNDLTITGYYTQSDNDNSDPPRPPVAPGFSRTQNASYRGELDYAPDLYGFRYEHLYVGSQFDPQVGFLRRETFRRNYASARFSPRPGGDRAIRRHVIETEFDYITGSDDGVLETREVQLSYRAELRGNDQFNVDVSDNYEFLREGFNVVPGQRIPAGAYRFSDFRTNYVLGPQRRIAGTISGGTGSFYGGTNTELAYRGTIELSPAFILEPGITFNWITLPQLPNTTTGERAFDTQVISTRASYMFSPYMAVSALVQYNSTSSSLGSSVRFRWEYAPGSDVFVVYSDGRNTQIGDRFPGLQNRTFVVKATRLFRF